MKPSTAVEAGTAVATFTGALTLPRLLDRMPKSVRIRGEVDLDRDGVNREGTQVRSTHVSDIRRSFMSSRLGRPVGRLRR